MNTRIAGVKFNNDKEYGGESRQYILQQLYESYGAIITVDLKRTYYNNEPAIQCIEHTTRRLLGWIPKTDIEQIKTNQMTGIIYKSKHGYSVELSDQQKPSKAQYQTIKSIYSKNNQTMPAYDKRAYAIAFAKLRNN